MSNMDPLKLSISSESPPEAGEPLLTANSAPSTCSRASPDKESSQPIAADDIEGVVRGTVGVDSGGSFNKLVFFRPIDAPDLPHWVQKEDKLPNSVPGLHPDPNLSLSSGVLRFIKFPRHQTSAFIDFCKKAELHRKFNIKTLNMTGGGAYRYADEIQQKIQVPVQKLGEMETLISGLNFLLEHDISEEVFTVDPETKEQQFGVLDHLPPGGYYPYLLVNMGSGVSILKITGPNTFERVSGSSLGGGTFWGLARLLASIDSSAASPSAWEEVVELCKAGDSSSVDLLVGDIYGEEDDKYAKLGLNRHVIASSFGKVATSEGDVRGKYKAADIVSSLMKMLANNIGQIAYLVAELHKLDRIFFAGGLIEHNDFLWHKFSFAINFWSKGSMKALFLRHNGYLGALGAIIHKSEDLPGDSSSNDSAHTPASSTC